MSPRTVPGVNRQIAVLWELSFTDRRHFCERTGGWRILDVGTGVLTPTVSREAWLTRPRLPEEKAGRPPGFFYAPSLG